jgi:hypothetical protein
MIKYAFNMPECRFEDNDIEVAGRQQQTFVAGAREGNSKKLQGSSDTRLHVTSPRHLVVPFYTILEL